MVNFDYEYKTVNTKDIFVDTYQRKLDRNKVRKIAANFNNNIMNPIKVSYRDGKYYVFDGQHTEQALILMNDGKDTDVYCKVYYGMSYSDEARMFAAQNGISTIVGERQKLLSLYLSGDETVMAFKTLIESTGLACDFERTTPRDNAVTCYKALYDIFTHYGDNYLKNLLQLDLDIWNGEMASLRKEIIMGLHLFNLTYKTDYDRNNLVKKLKRVSPLTILRDGRAVISGGNKRFARQILNLYNQNLGDKNRLDDEF